MGGPHGRRRASRRGDRCHLGSCIPRGVRGDPLRHRESFEPAVLRDMGKISGRRETSDETVEMIQSYLDAGMFVILSMIYDFPSESAAGRALRPTRDAELDADSRTRNAWRSFYNRFLHCFTALPGIVFKDPAKFGIGQVERASRKTTSEMRLRVSQAVGNGTSHCCGSRELPALEVRLERGDAYRPRRKTRPGPPGYGAFLRLQLDRVCASREARHDAAGEVCWSGKRRVRRTPNKRTKGRRDKRDSARAIIRGPRAPCARHRLALSVDALFV